MSVSFAEVKDLLIRWKYRYPDSDGRKTLLKLAELHGITDPLPPSFRDLVYPILKGWADLQGHDRCFNHQEILEKLCGVLGIPVKKEPDLPREEFEQGCTQHQEMLYGEKSDMDTLLHVFKKLGIPHRHGESHIFVRVTIEHPHWKQYQNMKPKWVIWVGSGNLYFDEQGKLIKNTV